MTARANEPVGGHRPLDRESLSDAMLPLSKASTLPAEAYTSPAIYQRETDQIFLREWLCAGRIDQIPSAGDYITLDLLGDKPERQNPRPSVRDLGEGEGPQRNPASNQVHSSGHNSTNGGSSG